MKLKLRKVTETRNSFAEVGLLCGAPKKITLPADNAQGEKKHSLADLNKSAKSAFAPAERPVVIVFKSTGAKMSAKK